MLLKPHVCYDYQEEGFYYVCAFGSPEIFEICKDTHYYYDGFMHACVNGNYDMVKHILEYSTLSKSPIHPSNSTISKALEYTDRYCFTENRAKIIELLVSSGGSIQTKSRHLLERVTNTQNHATF
jgi:histidinol phosphatase-like PHP family hydrolase